MKKQVHSIKHNRYINVESILQIVEGHFIYTTYFIFEQDNQFDNFALEE